MVKQGIQYYFLNKKNTNLNRKSEYVEFDDIRKVAILFDYSIAREKLVREFISKLKEKKIIPFTASYIQTETENILIEDIVYFKDEDFNIVGNTKDIAIIKFLKEEYDILFDLREKENIVSNYMHRCIKRKFSVGSSVDISLNDMCFDTGGNFSSFSSNIIEYLNKIKKA